MENIQQQASQQRPVFLTVLGILSFVGIALAILSAVISILTFESSLYFLKMNPIMSDFGIRGDYIQRMEQYGILVYVIVIISNIGCLIGVLLMWKLKKLGFYIYAVNEFLPIIANLVFLGTIGGIFGSFTFVVSLIFPIAFVVMYAFNLKHMK